MIAWLVRWYNNGSPDLGYVDEFYNDESRARRDVDTMTASGKTVELIPLVRADTPKQESHG